MLKGRNQLMISLLAVADLLATVLAWAIAYALRMGATRWGWSAYRTPPMQDFLAAFLLSLLLALVVFSRAGLYGPKRTKGLWIEMMDVARAVLIAWVLTCLFANLMRHVVLSRLMMGALLGAWLLAAAASRLTVRLALHRLRKRGVNIRTAVIVGAGRLGQKLFLSLKRNAWTGIDPRYFIDDAPGRRLFGLEVLGPVEQVDQWIGRRPVDIVFVALAGQQYQQTETVLNRLAACNVDVRVIPDLLAFHFLRHDVTVLDNLSIIALTYSPQQGWNNLLKRAFDLAGATVALALLALPMLLIGMAVKLTSPGPVFYRQRRASLNGRQFDILKFRTMVLGAEERTGPVWATPDDPRVTGIGRLLRRLSLDELPQLFNVLGGQMSLVGPRPERPELIERFRREIPRYMLRHQVKAGLTGWAQVHGLRGRTSLRKRIRYDLYYVANWTFGLDLRILLMTLFRGFVHPNAY